MAFSGVLNEADVKAALDGCSGEHHYLSLVCNSIDELHSINQFIHIYYSFESSLQIIIVTIWLKPQSINSQFENVLYKLANHSYHITSTLKSCVVLIQPAEC